MGLKAGSEFKDPKPHLKGAWGQWQTVGAEGPRPHFALILHNAEAGSLIFFFFFLFKGNLCVHLQSSINKKTCAFISN